MPYYPSSERSSPVFEAPWREYRRRRAARRRRRWAAIVAGFAVILASTIFFWPRPEGRKAPDETAALETFDTPGLGNTVIVSATEPSGDNEAPSPATPPEHDAIATLVATPEFSESPPEIGAVAAESRPVAAPVPFSAETAGSTAPPTDAADPEPADAADPDESWTPTPASEPMPAADEPEPEAKSASMAEPWPNGAPHVQLASFRSEARAQTALEKLRSEQSDILGGLDARVRRAELPDGRIVFRVQAGPLPDAGEAKRICAELHRRRLDCRPMR